MAVVSGRTRTLVEKFERREKLNSSDDPVNNNTPSPVLETDRTPTIVSYCIFSQSLKLPLLHDSDIRKLPKPSWKDLHVHLLPCFHD